MASIKFPFEEQSRGEVFYQTESWRLYINKDNEYSVLHASCGRFCKLNIDCTCGNSSPPPEQIRKIIAVAGARPYIESLGDLLNRRYEQIYTEEVKNISSKIYTSRDKDIYTNAYGEDNNGE